MTMAPMYRLGERKPGNRKSILWFVAASLLVLAMVAFWAKTTLHADTHISAPPPPTISTVADAQTPVKHFNESAFSIDLPSDWKTVALAGSSPGIYQWSGGTKDDNTRSIEVYVDHVPTTLGVNRVVAVRASGSGLTVASDVSDNCSNFTRPTASEPAESTHAKWNGINFLCDLGNYLRDVVGTSSPESINSVTLTGPTTGMHTLFFTYTDNSPSPDYATFINALKSFQLK